MEYAIALDASEIEMIFDEWDNAWKEDSSIDGY